MHGLVLLYQAQPFWSWAALAAALLAIEIVTGSGWLLWAAASAGVTAIAVNWLSFPAALLLFAVLTMVSTLLARRYIPHSALVHGHDINDNVARLVGHTGSAVAAFSGGAGRVFIDGKEWPAELEEDAALGAGEAVRVTGVDGTRLKVRRA
jgi:inner membrane protein